MAEDRTTLREGRLKRWSRLKRSGAEEAPTAPAEPAEDDGYAAPDPHALPGGAAARRGAVVPPMASLVRDEAEAEVETGAVIEPPDAAPDPDEMPELTPEEEAVVRDLPPIDSLTKESDFTPFLADKVPEFIRRRALAVLWRSDPVLANLDGLNDYDLNYRLIDTLIDAAKDTAYRVGKGFARDDDEEADGEATEEIAAEATPPDETVGEKQPEIDETSPEAADSGPQGDAPENADGAEPADGELPKSVDSDSA